MGWGILSAIGSGIKACASAAWSGIKSVGTAVASFAGSAISAFGKMIGGKAGAFMSLVGGIVSGPLGGILGPIIGQIIIKVLVKAVEKLAKMLGVIKEEDNTEELGYRIEEANKEENKHWKQKEEFDTLTEYYDYLKRQIPDEKINYDRLKQNRDFYAVVGMAAETAAIEEELKITLPPTFLFEAAKSRMEAEEIRAFADAFRGLGYDSVDVLDYFKGIMAPGEAKRITEAIVASLKEYCKDKTESELYTRLGEMQAIARDDNKLKDIYKKEIDEINEKQQIPEV